MLTGVTTSDMSYLMQRGVTPSRASLLINGKKYHSGSELANELGISRQTFWRWRSDGKIPQGLRFRDKRILFTPEEADEIREFATRLVPASSVPEGQLKLFTRSRRSRP